MKHIICIEPGKFILKEGEVPQRESGQTLVGIKRIGICGTDLHAFKGNQPFFTYPRILGHELSGEILDIDPEEEMKIGDQVIIMPYLTCGYCIACRSGKSNCCEKMNVLGVHSDGGMQEVISVPTNILIPANGLSAEACAIVEPLAIGAHAVRRAEIKKGESVLVIGCGPIGLGIIRQAQLAGANVIVMDVNEDRLQFVKYKFGVGHIISALQDPIENIKAHNNNELPTIVFDATGNKVALETGVQYMAHGGKYVLVGLYKGDLNFHHPLIHSRETSLLCSRNATMEDMLKVRDMLLANQFPVEDYITHTVPFDEMLDHFEGWTDPKNGVIKAMVRLES